MGCNHPKGGDITEWAIDLQVREFPVVATLYENIMPDICGYWDRRTDDPNYINDDWVGNPLYRVKLSMEDWYKLINNMDKAGRDLINHGLKINPNGSLVFGYTDYNYLLEIAEVSGVKIKTDIKE